VPSSPKLLLDENLSDRIIPQMVLRVGNCPTRRITQLLRSGYQTILAFDADPLTAILVLP
jgi:hypothetical protein